MENEQLLETEVVTLTLDDNEEVECSIITTYEIEDKEYIVLLPLDENGDVWIYRFVRDTTGGNDHEIINIEDDDEYEIAVDKFDEWLDTQEFNEVIE